MSIMTQITNSMLIIKASTFTLKIYVACSLLNYLYNNKFILFTSYHRLIH